MPRERQLEVALPMAAVAPYALAAMHHAEGMEGALRRGLTAALATAGALDFAAMDVANGPLRTDMAFRIQVPTAQVASLKAFARRAHLTPEAAASALLAWVAEPFEGDLRAA